MFYWSGKVFKNRLYHFTALNTRSIFINDNIKQVLKHFQSYKPTWHSSIHWQEIAIPVTSIAILNIAGEAREKKTEENETQAEVWSLSRKREQISNRAIKRDRKEETY